MNERRHPPPDAMAQFAARRAEIAAFQARLPALRTAGFEALQRLMPIAQCDTGQSQVIARFLLSLYNGDRFPFDLTDFRRLDLALFNDCMAVLAMDFSPEKEVHKYFENGGERFESLAKEWGFRDFYGDQSFR